MRTGINSMETQPPSDLPAECDVVFPTKSRLGREDTFFLAYRYANHAGTSGYDRFADYLGETIEVSPRLKTLGETALRIPAKFIGWFNGSYEYGRHDFIREIAVRNHMKRHRDGIYHFLYAEKSLRFLGRWNRKRGHRIVGSFHHCAFKYPQYFRSTKHFAHIEHAVVVSSIQLEHMEAIMGKGNVTVVPYAVDANYFVPATTPVDRPLRCTCVGQHLRDYETLQKIVPRVRGVLPDTEFYVIGANSEFDHMREMPGVIYKKGIPDSEYLEILQNTDVLLLPLLDSTSVTTVNEALACGVPIITNVGGVSDYLNNDCAIQHAVGDVDAMLASTVELLRDDVQRHRMALAARVRGEELDWPNSAAKMAQVYDKLA